MAYINNNDSSRPLHCLVLGGSGSLGREVCGQLHRAGAQVQFTYLKGEQVANQLVSQYKGMGDHKLDLSSPSGIGDFIRQVARETNGIDALIHTAGVGVDNQDEGPLQEFPTTKEINVEEWDHLMSVNLRSVFLACQALPEAMSPEGGNLVLLGSIDGTKSVPAPLHYAASKGAIDAMTRTLAKELKDTKIKVNAVVPGVLNSGLSNTLPEVHKEEYLKHTSAKRLGTTSEVASLIVWLALKNTYINGQSIIVDGGL